MLKGITKSGEMKNVRVSDDGELLTKNVDMQEGENVEKAETTLNASIMTLSTEAQTIEINKKVTEISVANYSETAGITVTIGERQHQVGANLAIDLPINSTVASISLVSTEIDTKVQLVIKGVE